MRWQNQKKMEQQKENPTTMELQEQHVQSTVQSNLRELREGLRSDPGTYLTLDDNISMQLRAGHLYDIIYKELEIEKGKDYTVGELITKFRNLGISIHYVGKTKMPPGDVDFSISEEFTSGFRQRFLENVLFETEQEKKNFEDILKIIDKKVTVGNHVSIDSTGLEDSSSYITIFGLYEESPDPTQIFVLEMPY